MEEISVTFDQGIRLITEFGLNILQAVIILVLGLYGIKVVRQALGAALQKAKIDPTLRSFVDSLSYILMVGLLIVIVLSQVGVETASLVAVLGAVGLAIGLSLQGSLSNFASGVLIIFFRYFRAGDFIEAAGELGIVREITIFNTHLKTYDNRIIIIPNSKITEDNIENFSILGKRRINLIVGISYGSDIDKAREVAIETVKQHPKVLKDPAPTVVVESLGDSSVNLGIFPWVKPDHHIETRYDLFEAVKKAFDANGVTIPFPQRDVHFYDHSKD